MSPKILIFRNDDFSLIGFDIYITVAGAIDVRNQYDRLEASGASGHEYLGVGIDILIMGVALITFVGMILSFVTLTIAQSSLIRIVSGTLFLLFIPVMVCCFFFCMYL